MKGRESGMPEEDYWQSFFDADAVVKALFEAAESRAICSSLVAAMERLRCPLRAVRAGWSLP